MRLATWVVGWLSCLALGSSSCGASSLSSQQLTTLFPKQMYDLLQCQVCQTPELVGSVEDSGCNYETVDTAVSQHFHPLLSELSRTTFFRYFKVDLNKECPFWNDAGVCASIDCSVCACQPHEIPRKWYEMDAQHQQAFHSNRPDAQPKEPGQPCPDQTGEGELARVERRHAVAGQDFREWNEEANPEIWSSQDESDESNMVYVNLLENPERYTGYAGFRAGRIWQAIYMENCFLPPSRNEKDLTGMCLEERVFYRLISGLQASISTQIALNSKTNDYAWGKNVNMYVEKVGKHRERLQNLYFTYLFVMRAVGRYRNQLLEYDYETGNPADDHQVREILRRLVYQDDGYSICPKEGQSVLQGFNEQDMFHVHRDQVDSYEEYVDARAQKRALEIQFRTKFQNVSRIMDCVSCEKCKLWGKLQTMGIGTAIKILLAEDVQQLAPLNRNELIALINVANNLAASVDGVKVFRHLEVQQALQQCLVGGVVLVLLLGLVQLWRARRASSQTMADQDKKTK